MAQQDHFGTLKYPSEIDAGTDNFFPEAICFSFYERIGVDFKQLQEMNKNKWEASKRTGHSSAGTAWLKQRVAKDAELKRSILKMQANNQAGTAGTEQINAMQGKMAQDYKTEFGVAMSPDEEETVLQNVANVVTNAGDLFKEVQRQNTLQRPIGNIYLKSEKKKKKLLLN